MSKIYVIKKDTTLEEFDINKIFKAVQKSAERVMVKLTQDQLNLIEKHINKFISNLDNDKISVSDVHHIVEASLDKVNKDVAKAYRDYRNYKVEFVHMLDEVYKKSQSIRYIGDNSNANTDSTLVSTQRSLIYSELNSELYKKFFLNTEELEAMKDGYIYVHDRSARLDTMNCCLFDMANVLKGGFEMGNVWYNEPKSLDTAFDVISDVTLSAAAMQYGGFTIPEIDTVLVPYAYKSYEKYIKEYCEIKGMVRGYEAEDWALKKVKRDMEQGFQGLEYKFNTVGSSRGDYPFIAISFGIEQDKFGRMATSAILKVRKEGQGKEGFKRPVLFPKLTFLYDENLHGENKPLEYLFDEAIDCSSKCMYPDFLSLTGEGYIPSMYKKYDKVVSLMGCRASLSPWYERGGMHPLDDQDKPIFVGRFNLGAISLNLPMILAKSKAESKDFYEVLNYYLELIRNLHKKTFDFLANKKAGTNPLGYCQGGFLNGNKKPEETLGKEFLRPMTLSFGVTALNELEQLYHNKSLVEDGSFSLEVMKYINDYVNKIKEEDNLLYAVYGTPAESLSGLQVKQFRLKYGIVENVSDKSYVSNSFHCHVSEDITPIEKQELENRFWNYFNGGKIQYCKYPIDYNVKAIKDIIKNAMKLGFYEGVNLSLSYCEDCGYQQLSMDECPKCHSHNITKIDRMNGYLGYTRIHGKTRYNDSKNDEIKDRVSM